MNISRTGWRIAFQSIRSDFKSVSDTGAALRHVIIQGLTEPDTVPPFYQRMIKQLGSERGSLMSPPWDHDARKHGILYGPYEELKRFEVLAERAWLALPGSVEGKLQAYPLGSGVDRWLLFVYRQLRDSLPNYLRADRMLWARWPTESGGMQELGFPEWACGISAEGADAHKPTIAESHFQANMLPPTARRWLIDEPAVDVFTASVLAIDQLLAHPDPEGPYQVSIQQLDVTQRSAAFQNANYLVDFIYLGNDQIFSIYRNSCKAVAGTIPSMCPSADPPRDEKERASLREYLPQIEQRFRELGLIKDGETIHWVGHQATLGGLCRCDQPIHGLSGLFLGLGFWLPLLLGLLEQTCC